MKRFLILSFFVISSFLSIRADKYTQLAQSVLDWVKIGQADSLLLHSSSQIKAVLSPQTKMDHLFRPLPQMATPADYTQFIPMANEAIDAIANFVRKE